MDDIVLSRAARSLPISFTDGRQDHVSRPCPVQKRLVHRRHELEESQGRRWLTSYDLHLAAPDLVGQPRSIARGQGQDPGAGRKAAEGPPVVSGPRPAQDSHCLDTRWQRMRARQGVRASRRPSGHREFVQPQVIGQLAHVSSPVEQLPPPLERRQAMSGTIRHDQANSAGGSIVSRTGVLQPRATRGVAMKHRGALTAAVFRVAEGTPVPQPNDLVQVLLSHELPPTATATTRRTEPSLQPPPGSASEGAPAPALARFRAIPSVPAPLAYTSPRASPRARSRWSPARSTARGEGPEISAPSAAGGNLVAVAPWSPAACPRTPTS
jgi:hypothetical protein